MQRKSAFVNSTKKDIYKYNAIEDMVSTTVKLDQLKITINLLKNKLDQLMSDEYNGAVNNNILKVSQELDEQISKYLMLQQCNNSKRENN
ncbi:hypothetical protein [Petroclostridium sp. X23]|uniref:hypothetical protein n=1 Tax=Petroclostridium sp. X23 TaxID=3045146 RepID=UPI0024ADB300|nr:hypothetical protein [Petroclostridium sp. X23]WHH59328.1 hypothetical protein QKW49_00735 [Petroclostridium sp. X23]